MNALDARRLSLTSAEPLSDPAEVFTPPNPGIWAETPRIVRRLKLTAVEGDVGQLDGGWLALAGSSEGPVLWCAGEGHAPAGIAPRYVSRDAFLALRDGEAVQGGAVAWNGSRWHLADVAEGARMVVRLVAEGTAA